MNASFPVNTLYTVIYILHGPVAKYIQWLKFNPSIKRVNIATMTVSKGQ